MRYEPASAAPTVGGCQTGTLALGHAIRQVWPEFVTLAGPYGCYNRRRIAGTSSWSLHAEGRALDVGFSVEQGRLAWDLACELVSHRTLYGVMRVILDRHIWSTEDPAEWRRLTSSTNQHLDHIHVEQFRKAAARPLSTRGAYIGALTVARA